MIKILFIIWSLEKGGAERFLVGLLKNIDLKKFQPVVCCLNWKGRWAEEVEQRDIEVIALNKKGGLDISAWKKLIALIKERRFDIVNTHLWTADVMGRIAAMICRVPIIISTAQNVDIWKTWWHRLVDRILAVRTRRIIAVSQAVKDYYHHQVGIPEYKIEVIPNAIDAAMYKDAGDCLHLYQEFDLRKEDFILVCIGRLTQQKGHIYLWEALKLLREQYPQLKVLIVGDGEERENLIQTSKEMEIFEMLRFTRQRDDIPLILKLAHGLILPSIFEGLPLCVLEAMAASRPVIATDVGGVKELAVEGKTAFIVPPKNSQSLADAIVKLYKLPDKGLMMGKAGREIVEKNFSIQTITQKTSDLFELLVKVQS